MKTMVKGLFVDKLLYERYFKQTNSCSKYLKIVLPDLPSAVFILECASDSNAL